MRLVRERENVLHVCVYYECLYFGCVFAFVLSVSYFTIACQLVVVMELDIKVVNQRGIGGC